MTRLSQQHPSWPHRRPRRPPAAAAATPPLGHAPAHSGEVAAWPWPWADSSALALPAVVVVVALVVEEAPCHHHLHHRLHSVQQPPSWHLRHMSHLHHRLHCYLAHRDLSIPSAIHCWGNHSPPRLSHHRWTSGGCVLGRSLHAEAWKQIAKAYMSEGNMFIYCPVQHAMSEVYVYWAAPPGISTSSITFEAVPRTGMRSSFEAAIVSIALPKRSRRITNSICWSAWAPQGNALLMFIAVYCNQLNCRVSPEGKWWMHLYRRPCYTMLKVGIYIYYYI